MQRGGDPFLRLRAEGGGAGIRADGGLEGEGDVQVGELRRGEEGGDGGGHFCVFGRYGGGLGDSSVVGWVGGKAGELEGRWVQIEVSVGAG